MPLPRVASLVFRLWLWFMHDCGLCQLIWAHLWKDGTDNEIHLVTTNGIKRHPLAKWYVPKDDSINDLLKNNYSFFTNGSFFRSSDDAYRCVCSGFEPTKSFALFRLFSRPSDVTSGSPERFRRLNMSAVRLLYLPHQLGRLLLASKRA
jgi:hypothetical protein